MSLSPCVGLCRLNAEKICIGCFRTIDEISRWGLLSSDEQRRILRQIALRQPAANASQESSS